MRHIKAPTPFLIAFTAAVLLGGAGCQAGGGLPDETSAMGDLMRAEQSQRDTVGDPSSVLEALPQESFEPGTIDELRAGDHSEDTVSATLVVSGRVEAVDPDSAWKFSDTGAIAETKFGSADADWQYVRVTVAIDQVVASASDAYPSDTVTVLMPAPVGDSLGFATKAYRGLGDSVFFLMPDSTSAAAPFRPLGSFGDWIFTLDDAGNPDGAPLAQLRDDGAAVLDDVDDALDASA